MKNTESKRQYDLIERTRKFALDTRSLLKKLNLSICNVEDIKQLARSSASVAANYIEANDSLSKRDFYYRIKICRKESKESVLFLSLLDIENNESKEHERIKLIQEGTELMKIFGSIITKANL